MSANHFCQSIVDRKWICVWFITAFRVWMSCVIAVLCWFREESQPKMPVLFSLSHALDEIAPVICRTGGMPAACCLEIFSQVCQNMCLYMQTALLRLTCVSLRLSRSNWQVCKVTGFIWLPLLLLFFIASVVEDMLKCCMVSVVFMVFCGLAANHLHEPDLCFSSLMSWTGFRVM